MRRKAWLWGFGAVLLGIGAFAIAVPKKRTPFEEGYGLSLVGETAAPSGGGVVRDYVSPEDYRSVVRRLDQQIHGVDSIRLDASSWSTPQGVVAVYRFPPDKRRDRLEGTATYVRTYPPSGLSPIQRFAALLGIKP